MLRLSIALLFATVAGCAYEPDSEPRSDARTKFDMKSPPTIKGDFTQPKIIGFRGGPGLPGTGKFVPLPGPPEPIFETPPPSRQK
jgi:hypothetical protein